MMRDASWEGGWLYGSNVGVVMDGKGGQRQNADICSGCEKSCTHV